MAGDINKWLNEFKRSWIKKDIKAVLNLFSDNVEYYETPNHKLKGKIEIGKIWNGIKSQDNIKLDLEVFCKEKNKYAVKWALRFYDKKDYSYKGIYLLSLDSEKKCDYFMQCCEE
jgi:hypothetical protein